VAGEFWSELQAVPSSSTVVSVQHGLWQTPSVVAVWLECITGEHGYSPGDRVLLAAHPSNTYGPLWTIAADSKTVQYCNTVTYYHAHPKTGSTPVTLTNARWNLRFYAKV
jgi:hypothetical protein